MNAGRRHAWLAAAIALASSAAAQAQQLPDGMAASAEASVDTQVRHALALLRARQPGDAAALLAHVARTNGIDLSGRDVVAVLFRLADGRNRPGAPTAGARPAEPPAAPTAEGEAPPPPSEETSRALLIDGLVDRLARWDLHGADVYLQAIDASAGTGPDAAVFAALRQVRADVAEPVAETTDAPVQVASGRPPDTIAGFEVLSLYGAAATYGFVLGTWAGLAVTEDERNASRIVLPLLGVAGGIVTAALLDRSHAVRRGRGYAVSTGLILGSLAGTAAVVYAQPREPSDGWGIGLAGATLGIGLSLGLAHLTDAEPGSMTYATSAGVWGSLVGLSVTMVMKGNRLRNETAASGLLVGEGVGMVLAMFTAGVLRPTPAQTRWADLGAAVGGLVGGGIGVASQQIEGVGVGMAVGILGGGVLAWFLAAPSEADRNPNRLPSAATESPLRFGVAPLPGGGMLTVGM